jgi:hypothetical protein
MYARMRSGRSASVGCGVEKSVLEVRIILSPVVISRSDTK